MTYVGVGLSSGAAVLMMVFPFSSPFSNGGAEVIVTSADGITGTTSASLGVSEGVAVGAALDRSV